MGEIKNLNQIILIGPMGAGKTTIGKMLGQVLGYTFYDSDQEIVRRSGRDIRSWFNESEEVFRQTETVVLKSLLEIPQAVIATGGGAILSAQNQDLLKVRYPVIYLSARSETVSSRLKGDVTRPLLQQGAREKTIQTIIEHRDKLYQRVADFSQATDKFSPSELLDLILKYLRREV